jgi:hypothetical protein
MKTLLLVALIFCGLFIAVNSAFTQGLAFTNNTFFVGRNPISVIAVDVNGDGKLDLINANADFGGNGTLTVLTNNGNGIFGSNATLNVGSGPACVVAADVNGDGKLDLICADNYTQNTLTVLTQIGGVNSAFVQTWTPTTETGNWYGIASSADGSKLAAVGYSGIYTSTNSGATWTQQTNAPNLGWYSIASSADGTKLVAGSNYGPIYTSTNSGVNWMPTISSNTFWTSIASSADGTKLVAEQGHPGMGPIYTSTNSGVTWLSNNVPSLLWEGVASSADGNKLVAVATTGQIYTSTNSGANWLQRVATSSFWTSVASSADGTKLVAVNDGGGIYASTNSGVIWTVTSAPTNYWDSVASSADGIKLVAVGDGQNTGKVCPIFTSTNSGITWTSNSVPTSFYWSSVASSADGNRLAATPYGSPIYTLQITPSPQLNIASYSNNMDFSWLVPSTYFVLEQSFDLTSWSNITNAPTLNLTNLQNQVTISPTNSRGFFRLITQ